MALCKIPYSVHKTCLSSGNFKQRKFPQCRSLSLFSCLWCWGSSPNKTINVDSLSNPSTPISLSGYFLPPHEISFTQLKTEILKAVFVLLLSEASNHASNHASQRYVQAVAASPFSSWPKVWDSALEKGAFGTTCSLALLRLLSLHTVYDNECSVPNCSYIVGEDSLCSHFLADHTTISITTEVCVNILVNCSEEIYSYGKLWTRSSGTFGTDLYFFCL